MLPRRLAVLSLVSAFVAFVPASAAEPTPEIPPPWAYGFKEPASEAPPRPVPVAPVAPLPDHPRLSLPDTERQFSPAEIRNNFAPADWYPQDHLPMPEIVAHGRAPAIWACARCHYPNGKGRPENAGIAGLPVDYFIE